MDELRFYTEYYIRLRFPRAPDLLRSALVEANAVRLGRLLHQRRHPRRIDLTAENPKTTPTVAQPAETEESAPDVLPERATINETSGPASVPPVLVTNETVIRALSAEPAAEVPRAPSIIVDKSSAFPPKPPTNECPYCGVIIEFERTAQWDNHVMDDLEPFICVFAPCLEASQHGTGPPKFGTIDAWISHMQNAHSDTWVCLAPRHDITVFNQEIEYREHVIKEHAVPEEYIRTITNAARRPIIAKKLERCPFGDHFQHPEESESSDVFSSKALQIHVAAHIVQVALLTLQKLPDEADGNSEEVDGDQRRQGNGSVLATLLELIHRVLEDEGYDL
ncbi:ankyrin [Metarhizium guizhouense ARSEF 977]|uniref:Ankyrin n=1 Tax=Metarhizium guizhouense (strain ARSEF 977) TaxID=1276136 RepID=A0A0B4GAW0_METGA|nr:ankyrin [Metarhizium guizhouense ARSEF 977]